MTPEEKATKLVGIFGKLLAIEAVDEIIEALDVYAYTATMYDDPETGKIRTDDGGVEEYWHKVKNVILNLT